jgi:hypothetical protein
MTPRGSEMVDHHVHEFMLVSRQLAALAETVQGPLRGGAIKPDQRAHEKAEAPFAANPLHLFRRADASLDEDTFEFAEIGRRQRLVPVELQNSYVALIGLQELPRLRAEPIHIRANRYATNLDRVACPDLVLEIRIHKLALFVFDQLDEVAQPAPARLARGAAPVR